MPGYFLAVTILDNPLKDVRIVQEEQCGPILPLLSFDDLDEVVGRAKESIYGLGASVWSSDLDSAQELASRLEAVTVRVNETQHLSPYAVFSGVKQSGIGVEGGEYGLLKFCRSKTISIRRDAEFA